MLTAGRIWWIHRQARAHGIHTSDAVIDSVSRIVFESGIMFPMFCVAALIVNNTTSLYVVDLDPIKVLSVGIAPTLIMVRAKLDKNVESLQDQISDICFTSRPAPREGN
ncbi:hypothetical protein Moror_8779 [Moniliophthora roreri MCA 2997]|uniref:Uncharacterized protein n=2 Tax=Moniliophthora roreri TaxID=221103 RepID=V2XVA5_MONRO|nr:hypothetical protein Moror_8779 [Moniliophthora roreri MCA 2997]KAI3605034.1 hypothetical protein WG66_001925 [Moniliophthora roreri]